MCVYVCAKKEKKNRTLETLLQEDVAERLNANLIFHSSVAREVENELCSSRPAAAFILLYTAKKDKFKTVAL